MSKENGGPAFPVGTAYTGMTLRDYFAAMAVQGMLAVGHPYQQSDEHMFARDAYTIADAMLAERSKP